MEFMADSSAPMVSHFVIGSRPQIVTLKILDETIGKNNYIAAIKEITDSNRSFYPFKSELINAGFCS